MSFRYLKVLIVVAALSGTSVAADASGLSDNFLIGSQYMGYDLQYRVYTPPGVKVGRKYPVLLVTDGQWYIRQGGMVEVLDVALLVCFATEGRPAN